LYKYTRVCIGNEINIIEIESIRSPEKIQKPEKNQRNFQNPEFFWEIQKIWQHCSVSWSTSEVKMEYGV
jgi:hypothetical protein